MRRREFLGGVGAAATTWPLAALAQATLPRVGWLATGSPETYRHSLAAFLDGLRASDLHEGRNLLIEYCWADGNVARLPALARELVQRKVDAILAGGSVGAQAARDASAVIPIVAAGVGDMVELGLVKSLARPDGNITGFVAAAPEVAAKRIQILREIVPASRRAAVLWNSSSSNAVLERRAVENAGFDITLMFHDARSMQELDAALPAIQQSRPDALVVLNDPFMFTHRKRIAEAANGSRLPAVYGYREYVEDGGLISYGANIADTYRRAAGHLAKILKGTQTRDLPVELPTKFELVLNLKTAKALGLDVSLSLQQRADEVIE
jgi:putative ABC transport system substrate-binding protein